MGQNDRALPHYEYVLEANATQYTERSLCNAAQIAYSLTDYTRALGHYTALAQTAESESLRMTGKVGMMRCNAMIGNHAGVVETAMQVINDPTTTAELRDEACLTLARSYKNAGDQMNADRYYASLEKSSNGEYSGEAAYHKAETLFAKKDYDGAEAAIERIVAEPHSDYWLAKTFILWADIFYARENNMQAKQTLQSIIENYDGAELVQLAQKKYDAIVASEKVAETNEEPQIEIELD
jgi:tetratricopeptide (TPR) repeat protein